MKKVIVLLFTVVSIVSCKKVIKELKGDKSFKGAIEYKSSGKEVKIKIAHLTGVPAESISEYYTTSAVALNTTYKLGITLVDAPENIFNDSISKIVTDKIYELLETEVLNLDHYDSVLFTIRNDEVEKGIIKRKEYIIEKEIE